MQTSTRPRPHTAAPGDGSRTLTITSDPTREEDEDDQGVAPEGGQVIGSLKLRGAHKKNRQRVAWDEDVVDNEGCGKKSSKICCIYHKPRRFDESSDESDSDSDDSSCGHDHANHNHNHNHNHNLDGQPHAGPSNSNDQQHRPESTVHELERPDDEPNAYEKQPGSHKGKHKAA